MEYWIWLSSVPYIGPVTSRRLLQAFGDPETVYRSDASDLCQIKGITQRQINSIMIDLGVRHNKIFIIK